MLLMCNARVRGPISANNICLVSLYGASSIAYIIVFHCCCTVRLYILLTELLLGSKRFTIKPNTNVMHILSMLAYVFLSSIDFKSSD
jgi:hypothetical protein